MGRRRKPSATPRTQVVIVQDKSGSMASKTDATISGFNEYTTTLKQDTENEVLLTLTQFDSKVSRVYTALPLAEVPNLDRQTYVCGGMTALYDAVGQATGDVARIKRGTDKVVMVIMTDGGENVSREWKHPGILKMFEDRRKDGWEFVFLGAGEEAWATSQSLGFTPASSILYTTQAVDQGRAFRAMATSTNDYRSGTPMAASLSTNSVKMALENEAGTSVPNTTASWTTGITSADLANATAGPWIPTPEEVDPPAPDDEDGDEVTT